MKNPLFLLRVILASLLFDALFFFFTALCSVIAWLVLRFSNRERFVAFALLWMKSVRWLEENLLGIRTRMEGQENLPPAPYILAAKHQSMWETLKLVLWFDNIVIVLKAQLLELPLWGPCVRSYGAIPVARSRKASDLQKMLDAARNLIAQRRPLVIFPQGTRVHPGEKKPYHRGVAVLYEELRLPVVPLILNSGEFWGRHAFLKYPGTVTVRILPLIPPGLSRDELMHRLEAALEMRV